MKKVLSALDPDGTMIKEICWEGDWRVEKEKLEPLEKKACNCCSL